MTPVTKKVGRITVAIGLIALGAALLLDNLTGAQGATGSVLRYWPVLLIGFGVEYLVRSFMAQRSEQEMKLKFDFGGAFLLLLVLILSSGVTLVRGWVSTADNGRITFPGPAVVRAGGAAVNNNSIPLFGPSVSRTETATAQVGQGKELQVEVPVGRIQVQPSGTASEIRVEATYTAQGLIVNQGKVQAELERIKLNMVEGDLLRVTAEVPTNINNVNITFLVYAPENLKVHAKTGAGSIGVDGYKGDLDLASNAGSINVHGGAGKLTVSSGAGSLFVQDFEGAIQSKTSMGSTSIRNANGAIEVSSGTGRIDIFDFRGGKLVAETRTGTIQATANQPLEGDVVLKTSTGSVTLTAPDESSVRATASTRTGSLQVPPFMAVTRNGTGSSASGSKGDGKYTVSLEAGTGSVHYFTNR